MPTVQHIIKRYIKLLPDLCGEEPLDPLDPIVGLDKIEAEQGQGQQTGGGEEAELDAANEEDHRGQSGQQDGRAEVRFEEDEDDGDDEHGRDGPLHRRRQAPLPRRRRSAGPGPVQASILSRPTIGSSGSRGSSPQTAASSSASSPPMKRTIAAVLIVAIVLVLLEPDFGTAVLLAALAAMVLFIGGVKLRFLAAAGLLALALFGFYLVQADYRVKRIQGFLAADM